MSKPRRVDDASYVHFITFSCYHRRRLLDHDQPKRILLGIVEGLTEFIPVSSTGHLILAGDLLGYTSEKAKVFEIAIQTGAMMAIVWEYRRRFAGALLGVFRDAAAQRFLLNLLVAFMPWNGYNFEDAIAIWTGPVATRRSAHETEERFNSVGFMEGYVIAVVWTRRDQRRR